MTSPLQRSLKLLRSEGWLCAIVEKWNPHVRSRQDLFGFADILAVRSDDMMLVQTTSGSNVAARVAKIRGITAAHIWIRPMRHIYVHGWSKRGPRGKRKLWECRRVMVRI